MKRKIRKRRKKCDLYRCMEITSVGVMCYGMLQIVAAEEMAKAIPETDMALIVIGTMLGFLLIILGEISRRIFKRLRITERKYWREDEKRVYRRAA